MTPRPSFASNQTRPLSAIFLGSVSTPKNLPDLPEPPPSPGAASNSSGLPSPPATNSTGSGSTGDDTTNFGSIRQRPAPYSNPPNSNLLNGYENEFNTRSTTNIKEDDEDDDNDNDDDNTARLDRRRSLKSTSENIEALQRVKSLTQRNRRVSDTPFLWGLRSFHRFIAITLDPQHVLSHLIPTLMFTLTNAFRNHFDRDSGWWPYQYL